MKENNQINKIANEIKKYLDEHPKAADNIEGITQWWLLKQRLKEHQYNVKKALLLLIANGVIEQYINVDGSEIYLSRKNNTLKQD